MVLARTSSALGEVVFEVRVAGRDLAHPFDRALREWRPAQIRVDDHAGRIDRPLQSRSTGVCQLQLDPPDEISGIGARLYFFTRANKRCSDRRDEQRPRRRARQPLVRRELVYRWQVAQLHRRSVEP